MFNHLRDPHRIGHIGFAAGNIVQMLGINQPHLELLFQQVVHRLSNTPR
jgi:hypothetical protein